MKRIKPKVPPTPIVKVIMRFLNFLRKIERKLYPPQALLIDLTVEDLVINRGLFIAAELGIADILKSGPKSIDEIIKETGAKLDSDSFYRIMRALASFGIFREKKGKVFETNAVSRHLEIEHEQSVLDFVRWVGSKWVFNLWVDIMNSVKNGKSYFNNNFEVDYFKWLEDKPDEQIVFNDTLIEFSVLSSGAVTAGYKFNSFDTIVDVAGGMGGQLISILNANPKLKGVLFELPLTVEMVKNDKVFDNAGLADRMDLIAGDFFESVPEGYDAYFMKSIIHDWKDAEAIKILTSCQKAMRKDSKLLLAELVIPEPNVRHFSYASNVCMLVLNEGRERTREDYSLLFKEAGLKLNRVLVTASPFSIVEAVKA
jgi:hypothetical protein